MATIKVTKRLRDRISRVAAREGLTRAALLTNLVDADEGATRFEAVRRAYQSDLGPDYTAETEDWDRLTGNGLRW
jgi:hypothetical protein